MRYSINSRIKARMMILLLSICGLLSITCMSQGKVVDDPGSPPKWISKKSFGSMIKERFKDSISGLDSMRFEIVVDKTGKAKRVVLMEDYFAPRISTNDFEKISRYINCCMKWKPAWVPAGKGVRTFECAIFEWVNFEYINNVTSRSN